MSWLETFLATSLLLQVRVAGLSLLEASVSSPPAQGQALHLGLESLASQLRTALASRPAPQPSVLAQLRLVLGVMVHRFPAELGLHQHDLRTSYTRELSLALKATTTSLDLALVEATLRGITAILTSFPLEDGEEEAREELYSLLRRLCRRPEQEGVSVRRGAMRAALELFSTHCQLFSQQVMGEVLSALYIAVCSAVQCGAVQCSVDCRCNNPCPGPPLALLAGGMDGER